MILRKALSAAVFSAVVLAGASANATILISSGPTGGFGGATETYDAMMVGSAPVTDSFATFSGTGVIAQGTQQFVNLAPTGDVTPYLSINNNQSETVTFKTAGNVAGFYWGSVDTYNTLTLHTSGGDVVITGSQIQALIPGDVASTTGAFVTLEGYGTITGLTYASSLNSFESDNLEVATVVPEVSTWAMMLLGFASVGFFSYRSRNRSSSLRLA